MRTVSIGLIGAALCGMMFLSACESHPPGWFGSAAGVGLVLPEGWSGVDIEGEEIAVFWKGERGPDAPAISVVHVNDLPEESTDGLYYDLNVQSARSSPGFLPMRTDTVEFLNRQLPALIYSYQDSTGWKQSMLTSAVVGEGAEKSGLVINCVSANGKFEGDKEGFRAMLAAMKLDN